jgi:hypothetical protein
LKLNKITTFALKNTDNFYAYLVKNPEAKKMFLRLENHIDKPIIGKLLNQLDEVPKIGPKAANGLRSSLQGLANVLSRLLQKPISIATAIPTASPPILIRLYPLLLTRFRQAILK